MIVSVLQKYAPNDGAVEAVKMQKSSFTIVIVANIVFSYELS